MEQGVGDTIVDDGLPSCGVEEAPTKVDNFTIEGYDGIPDLGGFEYRRGTANGAPVEPGSFSEPFKCFARIESGYRGSRSTGCDKLTFVEMVFDGKRFLFYGMEHFYRKLSSSSGKNISGLATMEWARRFYELQSQSPKVAPQHMPERFAFLVEGLLALPPTEHIIGLMRGAIVDHYERLLEIGDDITPDMFTESLDLCIGNLPRLEFNAADVNWIGEILLAIAWRDAREMVRTERIQNLDDAKYVDFETRFLKILKAESESCIADDRELFSYYYLAGKDRGCGQVNVALLWSYVFSDERFDGRYLDFDNTDYALSRYNVRVSATKAEIVWKELLGENGFDEVLNVMGGPASGNTTFMLALAKLLQVEDPRVGFVGDIQRPKSEAHRRAKGICAIGLDGRAAASPILERGEMLSLSALSNMSVLAIMETVPEALHLRFIYTFQRYLHYTRAATTEVWERLLGRRFYDMDPLSAYSSIRSCRRMVVALQGCFEVPLVARVAVERTKRILDDMSRAIGPILGDTVEEVGVLPRELKYLEDYQYLKLIQELVFSPKVHLTPEVRKMVLEILSSSDYQGDWNMLIMHAISGIYVDTPPIEAIRRYHEVYTAEIGNSHNRSRKMWLPYTPIIRLINLVIAQEFGWSIVETTFSANGENQQLKVHSPFALAWQYRCEQETSELSYHAQELLRAFYAEEESDIDAATLQNHWDKLQGILERVSVDENFPTSFSTRSLQENPVHTELIDFN